MVSSAGSAAYGTWKKAYAVAVRKKPAAVNQAPAPPRAGPANMRAKVRATARPPKRTYGRRAPHRPRVRSLALPTNGPSSAFHTLGSRTTVPASAAPTPSVSVR
ncbi:hypothetical protein GCM10020000_52530 [Streptomyces olivoverticillatus]